MGSTEVASIRRVVSRVRWRVRLQSAVARGLVGGAAGLFFFAVLIVLVKVRALPTDWTTVAGAVAIVAPAAALLSGLLRRLDDIRLATLLDASGGLYSRLGSALAFAGLAARTPMQEAAIADALTVLERASPRLAAPWRWSALAGAAVAAAVATAITVPAVWAFELPVDATDGAGLAPLGLPLVPRSREKAEVRQDDQKKLEALKDELAATEAAAADPTVRDFVSDLNDLIRALQEGKITPEEAHARLAALEKAMDEWKSQHTKDLDSVAAALKSAAEKKKDAHAELRPLIDALKEQKLEEAAKELEKVADKLAGKERLSDKDQKKLSKDLQELAKSLQSERAKEEDRLKKEKDRLKDKADKHPEQLTQKEKDRLKDLEKMLEQLKMDKEFLSQAARQLEQLGKDLDQAAQDMLRQLAEDLGLQGGSGDSGQGGQGDGPAEENRREGQAGQEGQGGQGQDGQQGADGQQGQGGKDGQGGLSAEDLKRAAEALRKLAQGGQSRQQMRAAEGRMVDVKEMLRRAAEGKLGQSGQRGNKQGQGGEQGEGQDAGARGGQKGGRGGQKGGEGEGDGDAWQQFEAGAKGEGGDKGQGEGAEGMMAGDGKGGSDMLLLGGQGDGKPQGAMVTPGRGNRADGGARIGSNGIGEGHDARLTGDKTSLDVKLHEDFVAGKQGDGESQSAVIYAAAQKGFASRGYAEVHQDYSEVVEDSLEREHIPAGKRTYVRKYFDLIRPR